MGGNRGDPILFFFSSRRRHTRSDRDWSSDVCSSDLILGVPRITIIHVSLLSSGVPGLIRGIASRESWIGDRCAISKDVQIGRASCRERV